MIRLTGSSICQLQGVLERHYISHGPQPQYGSHRMEESNCQSIVREMLKMTPFQTWLYVSKPWTPLILTTALHFSRTFTVSEKWFHINHSIPVWRLKRPSAVSLPRIFTLLSSVLLGWYYFLNGHSMFYLLIFLSTKLKLARVEVHSVMIMTENDILRLSKDRLGDV